MSDLEITTRVTGNDLDAKTQTGYSQNQVHTTATLPNTYPAQPNAGVHVSWIVIAKGHYSDTVFCDTTLTNYGTDIPSIASSVYSLWQSWANQPTATPTGLGFDVEIHWAIKLDNPTAPPTHMGSWVQAKHHYDGHLSRGNIKSASDIYNPVVNAVQYMQEVSKY